MQLTADGLTSTTTNTPKQMTELSLPDSPKLITPKRPRVKRTLNNTPQTTRSIESTPKRAKPEESCSGESPKVAEKKKPRKVTVISSDE